jgi:gluconokinase
MRAGTPLRDGDRWPWLGKIGQAIAAHVRQGRGVVVACSALKRAYRRRLAETARMPLAFVHLVIDPRVLGHRMRARRQHFMPVSLLESQLATLEPLEPDEIGATVTETGTIRQTVAAIQRRLRAPPRTHDMVHSGTKLTFS